jgi:hypothetical protein
MRPTKAPLETNLFSSTPKLVTSTVKEVPSAKAIVKSLFDNVNVDTSFPPPTSEKPAVLVKMAFNCTTA